jgi:hypothetical protein
MEFVIINDEDGNNSFKVEAETPEDAALEALSMLGWNVLLPEPDEVEE